MINNRGLRMLTRVINNTAEAFELLLLLLFNKHLTFVMLFINTWNNSTTSISSLLLCVLLNTLLAGTVLQALLVVVITG